MKNLHKLEGNMTIRKHAWRRALGGLAAAMTVGLAWPSAAQDLPPPPPYDPVNGSAPASLVVPTVIPIVFQDVSATAGDATLVLRFTTLLTNAWFDAAAPYNAPAVGVYTRIPHRPPSESADNRNMNVAVLYASHEVLLSLLPSRKADWDAMLVAAGLDPNNDSTDLSSPIGIGNVAGKGVVEGRQNDGMNQLGNEGGRDFNRMPYADYTGYRPVNMPERLRDPSRWQPDIQRQGLGLYKSQQFVTPQYRLVEPYSYDNPRRFRFKPPVASNIGNYFRYRAQAWHVLDESANLDDEKKLLAEFYDNKFFSLGFSSLFIAIVRGDSLWDFIVADFTANMAAFDAGIVVWQEKERYDAVRPFTAIEFLLRDQPVRAYGGPGVGTTTLPANEWKSYLEEADHPEYPSASTCFCTAHAQANRRTYGDDNLGWPVTWRAGMSRAEPGLTPAVDTTIVLDTWTEFAQLCGQSRVWAGVHFQAAVDESLDECSVFGDQAADYVEELLAGTAALRSPSRGRRDNDRGKGWKRDDDRHGRWGDDD